MPGFKKISRKQFIKTLSWLLLIPFGWLFNSMMIKEAERNKIRKKIILPKDIPNGITIMEPVIIVKKGSEVKCFSARCPHLGCIINHLEKEEIVCPCHGSRFSSGGRVIKGPSVKNLNELEIMKDKAGKLVVYDV
jgi:Rieske Fe-S protein